MNKFILALIASLILVFAIASIIWNYGYLDEEITAGEGYGFTIGESKQRIYGDLLKANGIGIKAIQVGNKPKDYKIIKLNELNETEIYQYDTWLILLDSENSFLNTIRLEFDTSKLVKIYRHKQLFELP